MSQPPDNSTNSRRGEYFKNLTATIVSSHFGWSLDRDITIPIGVPPAPKKSHKFDFASTDTKIVGKSKFFTWTETGNMPSAKMSVLNEWVLYLHLLPNKVKTKFIVLPHSVRPGKPETLAEYYLRTYAHLLGDIALYEIDEATQQLRVLKQ